jgi:hypothetical protein
LFAIRGRAAAPSAAPAGRAPAGDRPSALRARLSEGASQGYWHEALRIGLCPPGWRHYYLASFHAQLGQREEAFAELELAHASREGGLVSLRADARFDPIRDDPRYAELVRRVGIPER